VYYSYLLEYAIWKLLESTVTKKILIHKSNPGLCSWIKSTVWSFGVSTWYASGVCAPRCLCMPGSTRQPQHKWKQILSPN